MLISARLVTAVWALEYPLRLEVTLAMPGRSPWIVAFAEKVPSAIVTVGVVTATVDGSSLTTWITRPPAGAGSGAIPIGIDSV